MNQEKMSERELMVNIQILQEQAKIFASNVEMLTMYLQELHTSKMTLEGIKTLKEGDEILVPIGASSFIKARIDETHNVIVGVGANISMDKTTKEALENLGKRITTAEERIKENQDNYMKVASKLEELSAEAKTLLEQKGENV